MKRSYDSELVELSQTYASATDGDSVLDVERVVALHQPMIFVGSGGALAVAQLAADLHVHHTGELAIAMTPLDAAAAPVASSTGLVLFSARGRNPDAALAIATARSRGATHLGVVTTRLREELPPMLASSDVQIATVTTPPDGFLATNSLLAMATAICLAYGAELPSSLPAFTDHVALPTRHSCVAVTGPGTKAIGVDLEARLVETGLAGVQLADYRNLAHGRHVGLSRNQANSTIVAVIDQRSQAVAERTLALLPKDVEVVTLRSSLEWPASVLDLFVRSMHLVAATGHDRNVDPGRPRGPKWGRSLYHLPVRRLLPSRPLNPIDRKVAHRTSNEQVRRGLERELKSWHKTMADTVFGGVVLDYDGTCCATHERFVPPSEDVQRQIVRLLEGGITIGFATGRGKSLHETTRKWLPAEHWPNVSVGLYNGTSLLCLSDNPPDADGCGPELKGAAKRLNRTLKLHQLAMTERTHQLSIEAEASNTSGDSLLPIVQAVLNRSPRIDVQVVASGHSVDVIPSGTGKTAVVQNVAATHKAGTLVIGDQGQVNGNDFEMLATLQTTLSVDRVSLDPSRCWNLDTRGERGPDLLVRYLKALKLRKGGARFVWPRS